MNNNDGQSQSEFTEVSSITMLIERAKKGCSESRTRVIQRLEPFMLSMAARYNDKQMHREQRESDIVQQSLVRVIENFESFHGSSSAEFRGWLKSLVINEVRQTHRSSHRQCRDVKRESSLEERQSRQGDGMTARDPTPLTNAILKEQVESLKGKIQQLSELQQTIVRLRVREGLSFVEIGKRLDRKPDTVSKIWYRLLIQLERMMLVE